MNNKESDDELLASKCQTAKDIALARIHHKGKLANVLVQMLNKSWETFVRSEGRSAKNLLRILQFHTRVCTLDECLAEEMGAEGEQTILSKITKYDGDEEDFLYELKDAAFGMSSLLKSLTVRRFPLPEDELIRRLPLIFELSDKDATFRVLIHQVQIRQSAQEDVGFVMWPSAVLLANWIIRHPDLFRDKSILELGAGCGLSGLVTAMVGARSVRLTDFNPKVLSNLRRNVELNDLRGDVSVFHLDFYAVRGDAGGWICADVVREPVDVLIGADVICKPSDSIALAQTVIHCLKPEGECIVICADADHRFGVECFVKDCRDVGLRISAEDLMFSSNDIPVMELTSGYMDDMKFCLFRIRKMLQT